MSSARLATVLVAPWLAAPALAGPQLTLPPDPPENPTTEARANLGKVLFWDEQLSSTRTVSCGTCHLPEAGGTDARSLSEFHPTEPPLEEPELHPFPGWDAIPFTPDDVAGSIGVPLTRADGTYEAHPLFGLQPQVTKHKAPPVINSGFASELFFDGRAGGTFVDPETDEVLIEAGAALEVQALEPLLSDIEMGHIGRTWEDVVERIESSVPLAMATSIPEALEDFIDGRGYPELFEDAFGSKEITPAKIAMGLASYQRTLNSFDAPIDNVYGHEELGFWGDLGYRVFYGSKAACFECHSGQLFTDDDFHYTGVRPVEENVGRFAVTQDPADLGAMKTPSLRNVALRAPFFHDGSVRTLEEVIEFYDRGGDHDAASKDHRIVPMGLSAAEKQGLFVFLSESLTDQRLLERESPFDRPMLYFESAHVPERFGEATEGSDGIAPRMLALEPPLLGNPNWTVAVENGLGGGVAVLSYGLGGDTVGGVYSGVAIHLALDLPIWALVVPLEGEGPGEGFGSVPLPLPEDPGLVGASLFLQWFGIDPGAAGGFSATRAVRMTLYAGGSAGS
jgi:cytochrome c peroxidase